MPATETQATSQQLQTQLLERVCNMLITHGTILEADEGLNALNRQIIRALYFEHGRVAIGKINRDETGRALWSYHPELEVPAFSVDFVTAKPTQRLVELLNVWSEFRDYDRSRHELLDKIQLEVKKGVGCLLIWS